MGARPRSCQCEARSPLIGKAWPSICARFHPQAHNNFRVILTHDGDEVEIGSIGMEMWGSAPASATPPRTILEELARIQSHDAVLPTTTHGRLGLRSVTPLTPLRPLYLIASVSYCPSEFSSPNNICQRSRSAPDCTSSENVAF